MKPIVFEEVAKLFENEKFKLLRIEITRHETTFRFFHNEYEEVFLIAPIADKLLKYFENYQDFEKLAYEILKENGYVE